MSTYYTMKGYIEDETERADLSAYVLRYIKSAITFYENERFYFNEERAAMDTITAAEYYTLPTDFQKLDALIIEQNSVKSSLEPKPWAWIEEMSRSNYTAKPVYYALYRGELRLYPIPDRIYAISMGYVKRFATLSATNDTNAWLTDAERMIRSFAKAELYTHKIKGPDSSKIAADFRGYAEDERNALQAETAKRTQLGVIIPWGVI